jgi:hypothetical protein
MQNHHRHWLPTATPPHPCYVSVAHAESKDILDFYRDPDTRALFKLHIWGLISRVNPLNPLSLS